MCSFLSISTIIQIKLLSYLNYHTGLLIKAPYILCPFVFTSSGPLEDLTLSLRNINAWCLLLSYLAKHSDGFSCFRIHTLSIASDVVYGLVPAWLSHCRLCFTPPFSQHLTSFPSAALPCHRVITFCSSHPAIHTLVINYLLKRHSWVVKWVKYFKRDLHFRGTEKKKLLLLLIFLLPILIPAWNSSSQSFLTMRWACRLNK